MPLISPSGYRKKPFYLLNPHWETIIPSMFFKVGDVRYSRERLELEDGDFIDIDRMKRGSNRCMVISHGLEGGADRYYVKRTARYFYERGWDIAAWNCRSCSGEMNRLPRFYHHGATEDLHAITSHVIDQGYDSVFLTGYSMGGSMSLKFLGEANRDQRIRGAAVFSVPCNLKDSAIALSLKSNRIYEQRFLSKLIQKIKIKAEQHPEISAEGVEQIKTFDEFHDRYTAPLHGYAHIDDLYREASCDQYFDGISVPVLVVNALNDPLLIDGCYPVESAKDHPQLYLETPKVGGHAGFSLPRKPYSYMEVATERFINDLIS